MPIEMGKLKTMSLSGVLRGRGSLLKDLSITFVAQAVVLLSMTLTYGLVSRFGGMDELGAYTLVRRVVTSVQPTLLLGLAVALPRYIAAVAEDNCPKRGLYVLTGSLVMLASALLFTVVIRLSPGMAAELLFGSDDYQNLLLSLSVLLLGAAAHATAYSYYRGRLLMNAANLLQVVNLGVVPLVVVGILRSKCADEILTMTGVANILVATAFSPLLVRDSLAACRRAATLWSELRCSLVELLRYGLPRVPGLLAASGLLVLGPVLAAHRATMREVAYLNVSQGLLQIMAAFVAPLGLVILPRFSHLLAQGKRHQVQEQLDTLLAASVHIAAFVVPQFFVFAGPLLALWLGPEGAEAERVVRILAFALPFYLLYEVLRNPVDAGSIRALNARNAYVVLALFVVLSGLLLELLDVDPVPGLAASLSVSLCILGGITYQTAKKLFALAFVPSRQWLFVLLGLAMGGIAYSVRLHLDSRFSSSSLLALAAFLLFEAFAFSAYFTVLYRAEVKWMRLMLAALRFRNVQLPGGNNT